MKAAPWEVKQKARAAEANDIFARDFPVLIAAKLTLETEMEQKLDSLMFQWELWRLIPPVDCTNRTRSLLFQMISASGAGNEKDFRRPNSLYPKRAFLRLLGEYMGPILDADRWCSRDPWARVFVREMGGFSSDKAAFRLLLLALLTPTANNACEEGFSILRRMVKSRVQTHVSVFQISLLSGLGMDFV